jgi:glycosyltransferase involved in cell wall biosynthesis
MPIPEISVIIPAYNAGQTILRSLDSVRAQTLTPAEVIVVDDGSADDTSVIVSDYIAYYGLSNWRLLRQQNGGPARARDAAIRLARGSHIALLDADDAWLPEKLEISIAIVISHCLDLVGAGLRPTPGVDNCRILDSRRMLFKNPYFTSTVLFSRAAYIDIGGFDLNQRYSEDYKLWLAFAWRGKRCGQIAPAMAIYQSDATGAHHGLSSHLWRMEKSELENFRWLRSNRMASAGWCLTAQVVSWLKFAYRVIRSH